MIETTFANAINQAIYDSLESDKKVLCLGLGTTDPKGVFETTLGLKEKFGKDRVFDIPTSENAITGVCAGLGIAGYKPILTHQRLDFAILSLDQIINNAAKIHYMYGGNLSCPIVIRMIIGRGWGQGPTHSQSMETIFAQIPDINVVLPVFPEDSELIFRSFTKQNAPTIFIFLNFSGLFKCSLMISIIISESLYAPNRFACVASNIGSSKSMNGRLLLHL